MQTAIRHPWLIKWLPVLYHWDYNIAGRKLQVKAEAGQHLLPLFWLLVLASAKYLCYATHTDLDGLFVSAPLVPLVPELAREIERARLEAGLTTEELLAGLRKQQERYVQETYESE